MCVEYQDQNTFSCQNTFFWILQGTRGLTVTDESAHVLEGNLEEREVLSFQFVSLDTTGIAYVHIYTHTYIKYSLIDHLIRLCEEDSQNCCLNISS